MASKDDITFTIGFDVDEANQKKAFNKISDSYRNSPLAKLSRSEQKEVNSFLSRHNEEIANQKLKRFLNTPERGVGLLAKANKYRNEQDAMSKLMGVGSLPTAPAHEQYLALKQFKKNIAKEEKAFEAKISALASSLDNSIAPSADKKINDMMKERGLNEGLLAKAEKLRVASSIDDSVEPLANNRIDNVIKTNEEILKVASSIDDFVEPLANSRVDNAIKTKEEEMSKLASSLDETIGKSFEERINSIQTPSDAETNETDIQKENKALKDQEKEKKNNAKEEKGSLLRFSKMLVTLHLIKKVLNSIKDIWKRLSDTELKVTQRDVKEKGFFGVDAYSAMHANVDRSHAVISRGLGYMGAAAPFSMEAFDSVLKQLQDLNLKAISGQGIADDQLVISLQRLSDTLGMGFNIKDILTDPNLNLTDFLTNLMNSVEKFLPKLNSLDDIKKSLVTNDIIKALGPELANALVYNYNYNQRTGGTSTVMDNVTSKGTNAYGLIDYTKEAKKFADALASSRAALDDFKVALSGFFAPKGKKIVDQAKEKVAEGTMLLNALNSKTSGSSYILVNSGSATVFNKDKEELSEWYKYQENQEWAAKKLDSAKDFNSLDDVLNYAYYNPTALAAGTSSVGVEKLVGHWKAFDLSSRIKDKTWKQLSDEKANGKFTDDEWSVIDDLYFGHRKDKSKWVFNGDLNKIEDTGAWKKLFSEDGNWDILQGESPVGYSKKILGKELYEMMLTYLLAEKNNLLNEAGIMKEGGLSYYVPTDEKGNKISGTVTLRLELTDGTYRDIPTVIEDGVIKTMANAPALQIN